MYYKFFFFFNFRVPYAPNQIIAVVDGVVYKLMPTPADEVMICPLDCGESFKAEKIFKKHIAEKHPMYSFSYKCRGDGATPETLRLAGFADRKEVSNHCSGCKYLRSDAAVGSHLVSKLCPPVPFLYSLNKFEVKIFIF